MLDENKDFAGRNGFIWWFGIVESRNDPLKLGRCRVRCVGWHAEDKALLPTDFLPWAMPSLPTNHVHTYAPKEGDMVFGFFVDGENAQEPIIMGAVPSIPLAAGDSKKPFNDARSATELQNSPRTPAGKTYNIDGTGIAIQERSAATTYPFRLDEPTTSRLARNETIENTFINERRSTTDKRVRVYNTVKYTKDEAEQLNPTDIPEPAAESRAGDVLPDRVLKQESSNRLVAADEIATDEQGFPSEYSRTGLRVRDWTEPNTAYNPVYPYNNVMETESGHILEFDDTPGKERIHLAHRNGSFQEMFPNGDKVEKVTKNNYEIVMGDDYVHIMGSCRITVQGDAEVYVQKNAYMRVDKNVTADVGGSVDAYVVGNVDAEILGNVTGLVRGNLDAEVEGNATALVRGNLDAEVEGNAVLAIRGNLAQAVQGNMTLQVNGNFVQRTRGTHTVTSGGEMQIGATSNQGNMKLNAPNINLNNGTQGAARIGDTDNDDEVSGPNAIQTGSGTVIIGD